VVIGVCAVSATAAHAADHGIAKRLDGNGFCESPAAAHDCDALSFWAELTTFEPCNLNSTNAEDFVLCVDLHATCRRRREPTSGALNARKSSAQGWSSMPVMI
jgi:hypothetical protein